MAGFTVYIPLSTAAVKAKECQHSTKHILRTRLRGTSVPKSFSQQGFVGFNQYYAGATDAFDSRLSKKGG
ncbi:hypothetical protein [Liquorilactobacillus satsumensis]|uniref:hypothetical protein n=1 Tax=Liquorilactobacillus satsumensis TaxID=259059 RepID=UPI00070555D9|nr:hypothetical protein [Liquorilactobacillus satsumensis]